MSLLPEGSTFEEQVQEVFLAHRGSALMLSPLDAELLMGWAERRIPLEVVARGIRCAAEKAQHDAKPGETGLRSLRACRASVEKEIKKYLSRSVGNAAEGPGEEAAPADEGPVDSLERTRHKKLHAALRKWSRTEARFADAVARLLGGPLSSEPSTLEECERREEIVHATFVRSLPFEERVALCREARREAQGSLSREGRRMSLRFQRALLLKRKIELPAFW